MTKNSKYKKGAYSWDKDIFKIEKFDICYNLTFRILSSGSWVMLERLSDDVKYKCDYSTMLNFYINFGDPVYE